MKVLKTTLATTSLLRKNLLTYYYIDSYKSDFKPSDNNLTPTDVGRAFFSSAPKWIEKLFDFRNKIVAVFGLKTSTKNQEINDCKFNVGERLGLFQVFDKNENELILGEDDKHLNFRISLFIDHQSKEIIITTTVIYNNWFGKLYFLPVKPFHRFIVPSMLKAIIKELGK